MRSLLAFIRKEITEHLRSGRLLILGILFVLLGIMSPAVAKLTPWLLKIMADSLAGSGLIVTSVTVTALDSWTQFFKNIPMGLTAFVLLESGIFTREYRSGTLLLSLTKGLERRKVVLAKAAVLAVLWTACYWLCAGITWGYTVYYWDPSVVRNLPFSLVCRWLAGLSVTALMILFSTLAGSNTAVLAATGGTVLLCRLLSLLPPMKKILPTLLTDGTSLVYGLTETGACTVPLLTAAAVIPACLFLGIAVFDRKPL